MKPIVVAVAACALLGAGAPIIASEQHHSVVPADAIKWGPAPASLPPGAQAAVLLGHPAKEGPFVLRLKFPAGFVIPPHRHSKDELVTVISGAMVITAGEKLDRQAKSLPPASFIHLPAGMAHYAWAKAESVVQINGVGPFDVTYLNPADDPRKQ
ncbi:MAG TPA: cupin domain-containing protein [Burkholderiales bacterium]